MSASKSTAESRLDNIDILRGLAALAVTFFHLSRNQFLGPTSTAGQVFQFGYLGVDAFFVISGFIIPWALFGTDHSLKATPTFLLRRFFRLYPAYAAGCALALMLWGVSSFVPGYRGEQPHFGPAQCFGHLTLSCDFLGQTWLNPAFWTLAIEAQYYVLISLMLPFLVSKHPSARIIAVLAWLGFGVLKFPSSTIFPYSILFGFGILVFLEEKSLIQKPVFWLMLALSCLTQGIYHDWPSSITAIVAALWIKYAKSISFQPLVWLGTVSYSLYLVHVPIGGRIINLIDRNHPGAAIKLVGFSLACATAVVAAYLFYLAVEKPSHHWAKHLQRRGKKRALPASG